MKIILKVVEYNKGKHIWFDAKDDDIVSDLIHLNTKHSFDMWYIRKVLESAKDIPYGLEVYNGNNEEFKELICKLKNKVL